MKRVEHVDRYLRAQLAMEREPGSRDDEPGIHPFVTISREAGAGGLQLAETLLDVFGRQPETELFAGWQVYDRHLCEIVAEDPRYAESLDSLLELDDSPRAGFFHAVLGPSTHHALLMDRVFLVVHTLAAMGKSIIVGRGGSAVTRTMPQGVSLRLVAREDSRVELIQQMYGLNERKARQQVHKRDADRARLLKDHFGLDIADPTQYDVTWNTDRTSLGEIADAVVGLVRSRSEVR